jgi:hypothetical protein
VPGAKIHDLKQPRAVGGPNRETRVAAKSSGAPRA